MIRVTISFFTTLICCLMNLLLHAQDKEQLNKDSFKTLYKELNTVKSKKIKEGWTKKGLFAITFNQANFKNWVQGGSNSIAANISFKFFITYNDTLRTWDTRLWTAYGFTSLQGDAFDKKTQDVLELNSIYGSQIFRNLFSSVFLNFRTQFSKGYQYSTTNSVTQRIENSDFMSPGSIKVGVGALWKKTESFKINMSPLAMDVIFVKRKYVLPDGKYYGVREGDNVRLELGANLEVYSKLDLVENVSVEQIFILYANYLENFGNVDMYYNLSIIMKVNKLLSANFNFDMIYNDNAFPGLQTRQVLGVGISYEF